MRISRKELILRLFLQILMIVAVAVQQVVLIPVFLASWAPDLYATWLVLFSLSNLVIFLDLGLHPLTYLRLQDAIASKDGRDSAALTRVSASALHTYGTICLLSTVAAILFTVFLPVHAILGLGGASESDLRAATFLMILSGLLNVAISGFSAKVRSVDAFKSLTGIRILNALLIAASNFAALRLGSGIVGVASVTLGANLLTLVLIAWLAYRTMPEFRVWRTEERVSVATMVRSAGQYIIPVSGDAALMSIPPLLMGIARIPAEALLTFSVTRAFAGLVRQMSNAMTNPLAAEIGQLWVMDNKAGSRQAIRVCLTIVGVVTGGLIGYFTAFQADLVRIWTHAKVEADPVVFGFLFANLALATPSMTAFTALMYTDQPSEITKSRLRQLVAMTVLCIALGLQFEARGVAAGVFFSEVFIVGIPLIVAMKRRFGMPWRDLAWSSVGPFVTCLLISTACGLLACRLLPPENLVLYVQASLLWLPLPAIAGIALIMIATRGKPSPETHA